MTQFAGFEFIPGPTQRTLWVEVLDHAQSDPWVIQPPACWRRDTAQSRKWVNSTYHERSATGHAQLLPLRRTHLRQRTVEGQPLRRAQSSLGKFSIRPTMPWMPAFLTRAVRPPKAPMARSAMAAHLSGSDTSPTWLRPCRPPPGEQPELRLGLLERPGRAGHQQHGRPFPHKLAGDRLTEAPAGPSDDRQPISELHPSGTCVPDGAEGQSLISLRRTVTYHVIPSCRTALYTKDVVRPAANRPMLYRSGVWACGFAHSTHGLFRRNSRVRITASRIVSRGFQPRDRILVVSRKMNGLSPTQPRHPPCTGAPGRRQASRRSTLVSRRPRSTPGSRG